MAYVRAFKVLQLWVFSFPFFLLSKNKKDARSPFEVVLQTVTTEVISLFHGKLKHASDCSKFEQNAKS